MKYAIKIGGETYPINEDEVSKVMEAMATGSIVLLSCGFFRATYIQAIVRDFHAEKDYHYFYKFNGAEAINRKDFAVKLGDYIKNLKGLPKPNEDERKQIDK